MTAFARIEITGLRELQKALRDMDAGLPRQIRVALNQSSELVISYAKPKIPRRSGKAAASLKVRSSQRQARIAAGGKKAPYFPWLDFGGAVGRNDATTRPFLKTGRYIYPGVDNKRAEIIDVMAAALAQLATDAGLEVT